MKFFVLTFCGPSGLNMFPSLINHRGMKSRIGIVFDGFDNAKATLELAQSAEKAGAGSI